ncbi:MAG: dihydrolipoyl dehydrogenase [Clostridiales bacterium]|nr:dihydrolipoyl dehydrogenase [Clostridiales bacterium]
MTQYDYDVAVIGGGPGGYVAAIRGAQLGAKVALIEKEALGGCCLNRGCVPTKSLIESAQRAASVRDGARFGFITQGLTVDWPRVMKRKDEIVSRMRNGVAFLMKKNGVDVFAEEAAFTDAHTLTLGSRALTAQKFIVATGSMLRKLPFSGDSSAVVGSDEMLCPEKIPEALAIVGSGVIAVEFAGIYNDLGAKVTMIARGPRILSGMDREMTARLAQLLKRQGISCFFSASVADMQKNAAGKTLLTVNLAEGKQKAVEADLILLASGRVPYTQGLCLEAAGVAYSEKGIPVDKNFLTNQPHIAAIGDVLGGMQLAHLASAQGMAAMEHLLGGESGINLSIVPTCIYSSPELASVGLSEEEAINAGLDFQKAVFPLSASAKAHAMAQTEGMVKIVFARESGKILGVHILAPHATDIIGEAALAISRGLGVQELAQVIHPHPTIVEALMEAAHMALGTPINI